VANKLEVHCAECDSTNIVVADNAAEGARVACRDCGKRFGTIEDYNAEVGRLSMLAVQDALRNVKGFDPS